MAMDVELMEEVMTFTNIIASAAFPECGLRVEKDGRLYRVIRVADEAERIDPYADAHSAFKAFNRMCMEEVPTL